MSLTAEEKRAHAKALAARLEAIAERHSGVVLRSVVCGVEPFHAALAIMLIDAYELGVTDSRRGAI